MKIRAICFLIFWGLTCWISIVYGAEGTYTKIFGGSDKWDSCLYDHNIDVDTEPGNALLIKTELISDEMGNITDATRENVSGAIRAKKELIVPDPSASEAALIIYTGYAPKGPFNIEINGIKNTVTFDQKRMLTGGWTRADIDPGQLKKGLNTFVIYPAEGNSIQLHIDNCRNPNRSAKSIDAGKTWDYNHIGEQGFCDGEYLIRLRLSHYPSQGEVLSDYICTGDLITDEPVKPVLKLNTIQIKAALALLRGTDITLYLRGGSTPAYDPDTWDIWKPAKIYRNKDQRQHDWQFFQWRAVLSTKSGFKTPSLRGITVTATIDVTESAGKQISADVSKNRKIIRGYYNYAYQPYEDNRLKHLREYFRLDEVVGGCSSEFEKFEVLATWLRGQWRDGWYPGRTDGLKTPWDAWIALNLNSDFKASGMCTIYANTFFQCALAVGLNARGNVLDHHFVSEIWSNEHEKWILFDIGFNNHSLRTVHMELDNVSLSSVEILQAVNSGKISRIMLMTPPLWRKTWRGDQAKEAVLTTPNNWKPRVGIPTRNNYLESWLPGELQHGFGQYSYDGYLWWKKTIIPEYEEYTWHTSHYRDMYWTINQAQVFLSQTGNPGELKVKLDTVTPNLDKIMLRTDGGEWKETPQEFILKLKNGNNRIEVKPVNKWGLDGITSEVTIQY
jgi:hypothetical protein